MLALTASFSLLLAGSAAVGFAAYVQANDTGTHCFGDCQPSGGGTPSPDPSSGVGPCASSSCNYLLLGSDSRAGLSPAQVVANGTNKQSGGGQNSDVIMLVHTVPNGKTTILSFPRDLWVKIPGQGYNKINAAFGGGIAHGGPDLVAKTIYEMTGLKTSHYLYVDLAGFEGVVSALGGVDMCIPPVNVNSPDGYINDPYTQLHIKPGCQHLDGQQALAYVRARHLPCDLNGDFDRIGRQQQFLRALINRLLQPSELVHLPTMVKPILSNLQRDDGLKIVDFAYLVGQLRGVSTGDVVFRDVPVTTGTVHVPYSPYTLDIDKLLPQSRQIFAALRSNAPLPPVGTSLAGTPVSEANITIPVVDHGSGQKATGVEQVLSRAGFDISPGVQPYAAFGSSAKGTVLGYAPSAADQAAVVHTYFPNIPLKQMPAKQLGGHKVALFVTGSYKPVPVGAAPTSPGPAGTSACLLPG